MPKAVRIFRTVAMGLASALSCCVFTSHALAETGTSAVFVVLGGYDSCHETAGDAPSAHRTLVWNKFLSDLELEVRSQTGTLPTFVAGCYGIADRSSLGYYLDFMYFSSANPLEQELFSTAFFGKVTYSDYSDIVMGVVTAAENIARALVNPRIYVIGHSYGGWTSLQVAMTLLSDGEPVRSLYTIDPISPLKCNPKEYLGIMPPIPVGCRQAPADLDSHTRIQLRDRLEGRWFNFYETDDIFLHSGPIPELKYGVQDFRYEVHSSVPILADQHKALAADPRVWRKIKSQTLEDLQGSVR